MWKLLEMRVNLKSIRNFMDALLTRAVECKGLAAGMTCVDEAASNDKSEHCEFSAKVLWGSRYH